MKRWVIRLAKTTPLVAAVILVGWIWFGLGEFFFLGSIANGLPQPPNTDRIRHWPSGSSSSRGDMINFTPPDSWGMRETYIVPAGITQYEIMDFYISQLTPEWRWCPRQDDAGHLYGVSFQKGTRRVGVDTQGLQNQSRSLQYGISVGRKAMPGRCERATERALSLGLKPIPEGSPGHQTPDLAQQYVPFPIWVPTYFPEEYWMNVDAELLEGWPYGDGVKGVELVFRNNVGPGRDLEAISVRQFLSEGTSSHARAYLGDAQAPEVVNLGDFEVVVREGLQNGLLGSRGWVRVEWEGRHEGRPVVYIVDSGASREETLLMVRSFESHARSVSH